MTNEDQEIWKRLLHRTSLWGLHLMAKDHYSDDAIFREETIDSTEMSIPSSENLS
jgi:hypothetical protein